MIFLDTLANTVQQCEDHYLIIGGDFNCTVNDIDRNHLEPHCASRRRLSQLIVSNELCDIWRNLNSNIRPYTWTHVRENHIALARLDRFYCYKFQFQCFKSCHICPVGFSDHSMVIISVFINSIRNKSAYWHFNCAFVEDFHFRNCFRFFWEKWKLQKENFISLQQWWDTGKLQIEQFCNQYAFNVTKDIVGYIKKLEDDIVELQNLCGATGDQDYFISLKTKKRVLTDLLGVRAQGALVRSRFQNASEMDAPSRFFFGLERKNGQSQLIHCLKSNDGKEITKMSDIRRRAVDFYEELYSSEHEKNDLMAKHFYKDLPQVPEEFYEELMKPLSKEELYASLQSLKNGKAPGIDGLPSC